MAPMSPEAKAALMARLASGRAHHKKMRESDPNHKPRKPRAKKVKATTDTAEALSNPVENKPSNDTIPGIDAPVAASKNVVAAVPPKPAAPMSALIDVPNLPEKSKLKKVEKNAIKPKVPKEVNGLSTTGKPSKINANVLLTTEETGMMSIETMLPGQKESIKKVLKENKKLKPAAPAPVPHPKDETVEKVEKHVPDMKSVEARAPFSFATIRKVLYQ